MKENKDPDLDILTKVLSFGDSSEITLEHLKLFLEICNKRISMALPIPNTEHVLPFSKVVGVEKVKPEEEVMGCYLIKGSNLGRSRFTNIENVESYIGQAKHLGYRVKDHAKEHDVNTKSFISSLKGEGLVELFIITKETIIPRGLTRKEFLTLLEQYLIIKFKPTLNKKYLSTPGIIWSPETIKKHIEKVGSVVYVYKKTSVKRMCLIQIFPSGRSVGDSLDVNHKFYSNMKKRTNG